MIGTKIHVTGIVQGVGFRPFVFTQAVQKGLTGWVCNTSAGVDIEVTGEPVDISSFIQSLKFEAPPLARIDSLNIQEIPLKQYDRFEIIQSKVVSDAFQPISPDIGICPDCLIEMFDPQDRRYRYPFINCTNCGPRLVSGCHGGTSTVTCGAPRATSIIASTASRPRHLEIVGRPADSGHAERAARIRRARTLERSRHAGSRQRHGRSTKTGRTSRCGACWLRR